MFMNSESKIDQIRIAQIFYLDRINFKLIQNVRQILKIRLNGNLSGMRTIEYIEQNCSSFGIHKKHFFSARDQSVLKDFKSLRSKID